VDDGRSSIPASIFGVDACGKVGDPTVVQLKQAVRQHLAAHPEIHTTVPRQLTSDADYELLYTPPYVSDLQPSRDDVKLYQGDRRSAVHPHPHRPGLRCCRIGGSATAGCCAHAD